MGVTLQNIKDLAGQAVPPSGAFDVLAAALWLLGDFPDLTPPPSKKKKPPKVNVEEVVWGSARKVMKLADFRRKLNNIDDLTSVPPEALDKIKEYTNKEYFNPDK